MGKGKGYRKMEKLMVKEKVVVGRRVGGWRMPGEASTQVPVTERFIFIEGKGVIAMRNTDRGCWAQAFLTMKGWSKNVG